MAKTKCAMLPLPVTLPKNADAVQVLSVVLDQRNSLYVNVDDHAFDTPMEFGASLAEIACIAASHYEYDIPHQPNRENEQDEIFAVMCEAFNERAEELKRKS
jgi:hypothetical protein